MFQAGQSNRVTFKVNVMGTSSEPKVRVILSTSPEFSFPAVQAGDSWTADLSIPETLPAGTYNLRVEVILNNRLFTPLSKSVEVQAPLAREIETAPAEEPAIQPADLPIEEPTQVVPTPEPEVRISLIKSIAVQPEEKSDKKPAPAPIKAVAKMPKIQLKAEPKVEALVIPPAAKTSKLEELAKQEPKKLYQRVKTPLPKPGSVEAKPIKIDMSEIDSASAKIESRIVESTPAKVLPIQAKPAMPIQLITEQVFYE